MAAREVAALILSSMWGAVLFQVRDRDIRLAALCIPGLEVCALPAVQVTTGLQLPSLSIIPVAIGLQLRRCCQ